MGAMRHGCEQFAPAIAEAFDIDRRLLANGLFQACYRWKRASAILSFPILARANRYAW
jgi:hypothetical protein